MSLYLMLDEQVQKVGEVRIHGGLSPVESL